MAQSKAVLAILATAVALAGTIENEVLNAGIEALKAETDANGNTQEYKDLKDLVATLEAQGITDPATYTRDPKDRELLMSMIASKV